MNKILYTRPDGGVSIIHPVDQSKVEETLGPLSKEDYEAHVMAVSVPSDAVNVTFIADKDIPEKDEFRNAWAQSGSIIQYDLNKSKSLVDEKLQAEMQGYLSQQAVLSSTGKDLTAINAKISDCESRRSQLNNMTLSGKGGKSSLSSLKSLLPK
jgi:hypothetical protein